MISDGNTPICDPEVLKQWLESGVWEHGEIHATLEGTPQGGVISPLLYNVSLNGFEVRSELQNVFDSTRKQITKST